MKTAYVVGFVFNKTLSEVLLIRKNRPAWQKGQYNGIGGHVKPGEHPDRAIKREIKEECNLDISDWHNIAAMEGSDWIVHVYATIYEKSTTDAKTMTDEKIRWVPVKKLPKNVISNLRWLIPLALESLENKRIKIAKVTYRTKQRK